MCGADGEKDEPTTFLPLAPAADDPACSIRSDWTLLTATWRRAWSTFSEDTSPSTAVTLVRTLLINSLSSELEGSAMAAGRAQMRVGWVGGVVENKLALNTKMIRQDLY